MALFPKIESPCPYRDDLKAVMDGDTCTMCKREVYELTDMSDDQRSLFLGNCSSEVCVSYRLPLAKTLAGVAITSSAVLASASATAQSADSLYCYSDEDMIVIVGGLRKGSEAKILDTDISLADLPVVYENAESIEIALDEIFGMNVPAQENVQALDIDDQHVAVAKAPHSLQSGS